MSFFNANNHILSQIPCYLSDMPDTNSFDSWKDLIIFFIIYTRKILWVFLIFLRFFNFKHQDNDNHSFVLLDMDLCRKNIK